MLIFVNAVKMAHIGRIGPTISAVTMQRNYQRYWSTVVVISRHPEIRLPIRWPNTDRCMLIGVLNCTVAII